MLLLFRPRGAQAEETGTPGSAFVTLLYGSTAVPSLAFHRAFMSTALHTADPDITFPHRAFSEVTE